ncbi:MAG: 1-deoxy-D-xylulose-5-phosphate reductoisomerase [Candidatus Diapherotrites archaeon]|uniref:1-deoxy-D-xylulose-5-phosphate reductoisomerase n=1 Tax=Candidatus Iainarchaeum sp. TaxID=3101447 RepID=A0A8T4C5E2_9ARCH|nr:1-deoxy-D-xylulose-5-phosphate reductoisomerase [Candidatus Diapherotrites archaeon]
MPSRPHQRLAILGSTGSIGTQTLDIVDQHPNEFSVKVLTANGSMELLEKQVHQYRPEAVCLVDETKADALKKKMKGSVHVLSGYAGLNEAARWENADTIVQALVGNIGMKPTIEAIHARKKIALANKETLVSAGAVVMPLVKKHHIDLTPIDSEHSAIFQCLKGENVNEVTRLIITCSGGPFRGKTLNQLEGVTREQALNHPTWKMGGKITIDSATLMNKGFEVNEAMWLYDIPAEKIDVVVHPQSIIHSMVEFTDGSIMAQVGHHDMRIPIQYALTHPSHIKLNVPPFDFVKAKQFTFEQPDVKTFDCLQMGLDAAREKGTVCCVLNAANDTCVESFLKNEIEFLDIQRTIREVVSRHKNNKHPSFEDVLHADAWARKEAQKIMRELKTKRK